MTTQIGKRELFIAAIEHLNNAQEAFEVGSYGWDGRDATLTKFDRLQDALIEVLAPIFVSPIDPDDDDYCHIAHDRLGALQKAVSLCGPASAVVAKAARALADASERAFADRTERKALDAAGL